MESKMANSPLSQIELISEIRTPVRITLVSELLIKMAVTFSLWSHNSKSRKALGKLTDHQLQDIGVSRETASIEAGKSFWVG